MLTIYGSKISGNCYKARLTCALLDIDYEWVEINILTKENRESDFLAINPLGQVPVLKIENSGTSMAVFDSNATDKPTLLLESNAIIRYLAQDSWLVPSDPIHYAQMWQWLLYEQTEVRANIGSIRFIKKYQNMLASRQDEYEQKFPKAQKILNHLNEQLASQPFILGDDISLADIALYAYTHVANEGGIDMAEYHNLNNWFKRIVSLDNYVAL